MNIFSLAVSCIAVLLDGGLVAGDGGGDGPVQLPAQHPLVVTAGRHQVTVTGPDTITIIFSETFLSTLLHNQSM